MLYVSTKLNVSSISGIGLFANEPIAKGELIWVYANITTMVYTQAQWDRMISHLPPKGKESLTRFAYLNKDGEWELNLDDSRFMNHQDQANTRYDPVKRAVYSTEFISCGEEITANYNEFDYTGETETFGKAKE